MKCWSKYTKDELLGLPLRPWDKPAIYDFVCFVNTDKMHDSGFNQFAIIGFKDGHPEIAGYMDDFRFFGTVKFPGQVNPQTFAFDCSMNGVFRMHGDKPVALGMNVSTTSFYFVEEKND